jgi:GGDEF domain-containing protein
MTYTSTALSLDRLGAEIALLDLDLPVAVAMIDLDRFEQLNDTHGEAAGTPSWRSLSGNFVAACRRTL